MKPSEVVDQLINDFDEEDDDPIFDEPTDDDIPF